MRKNHYLIILVLLFSSSLRAQSLEFKAFTSFNKWHPLGTPLNKICNGGCFDQKDLSELKTNMSKIVDFGFGVNYVKELKKAQVNIGLNYELNGVGASGFGFQTDGELHRLFNLQFLNLNLGLGKEFKIKKQKFVVSIGIDLYSRIRKDQSLSNSRLIFIPATGLNVSDERSEDFTISDKSNLVWGMHCELKVPITFFEKINSYASIRVNNTFNTMLEYQWNFLGEKFAERQDNRLGIQIGYGIKLFQQ